jgi:hypothetical protein
MVKIGRNMGKKVGFRNSLIISTLENSSLSVWLYQLFFVSLHYKINK